MAKGDKNITSYIDPITRARMTVVTCKEHDQRLLDVLRATHTGAGSTKAPWFMACTPCQNEKGTKK